MRCGWFFPGHKIDPHRFIGRNLLGKDCDQGKEQDDTKADFCFGIFSNPDTDDKEKEEKGSAGKEITGNSK